MAAFTTAAPQQAVYSAAAGRRDLLKLSLYSGLTALTTASVARADEPVSPQTQIGPTVAEQAAK